MTAGIDPIGKKKKRKKQTPQYGHATPAHTPAPPPAPAPEPRPRRVAKRPGSTDKVVYAKDNPHTQGTDKMRDDLVPKPPPAAAPASAPEPDERIDSAKLRFIKRDIQKNVSKDVREKYGLTDNDLDRWAQTSEVPPGVSNLLKDYGAKNPRLFPTILRARAFGDAVAEARVAAGVWSQAAADAHTKPLHDMQNAAARRLEHANVAAVANSMALAQGAKDEALDAKRERDDFVKTLPSGFNHTNARKVLGEERYAQLQAHNDAVRKTRDEFNQANALARDVTTNMRGIRERRVEAMGGKNGAPKSVRHKAAAAYYDSAAIEANDGEVETTTKPHHAETHKETPKSTQRADDLIAEGDTYAPNWTQDRGLIQRRTAVLESQKSTKGQFVDGAKRRRGYGTPVADPRDEGTAKSYAKTAGDLRVTYQADLDTVPASDVAHKRATAKKARDLDVEITHRIDDGLDAYVSKETVDTAQRAWRGGESKDAKDEVAFWGGEIKRLEGEIDSKRKDGEDVSALQTRLAQTKRALSAAQHQANSGDDNASKPPMSARGSFDVTLAHELAKQVNGGNQHLYDARNKAAVGASVHNATVGSTYGGDGAANIEWGAENAAFIEQQGALHQRDHRRVRQTAENRGRQLDTTHRIKSDRLKQVKTALTSSDTPDSQKATLQKEKQELDRWMSAYAEQVALDRMHGSDGDVGIVKSHQRAFEIHDRRVANAKALDESYAAYRAANPGNVDPEITKSYIDGQMAAARTLTSNSAGTAATHLKKAIDAARTLPPAERKKVLAGLRKEALEMLGAMREADVAATSDMGALYASVRDAIYPNGTKVPEGQKDDLQKKFDEMEKARRPDEAFAAHRAELERGRQILEAQVETDIQSWYDVGVENGGMVAGGLALAARAAAARGDIQEAKRLLRKHTEAAVERSKAAEGEYKDLAPAQQEQYRAILRSTSSPQQKRDALADLFGGQSPANREKADRAMEVATTSATMRRANAPGSNPHWGDNAKQTQAAFEDPKSGVTEEAVPGAKAWADVYENKRHRAERYWSDPTTQAGVILVDLAALWSGGAAIGGAARALQGSRAAASMLNGGASLGRSFVAFTQTGRAVAAAGRGFAVVGRNARAVGTFVARGRQAVAGLDAALVAKSRALGMGFRFGRAVAYTYAIEGAQQGIGALAEKSYGRSSWVTWAAKSSSQAAVFGIGGATKGLNAVQDGAWNVAEHAVVQGVLPSVYAEDPKALAAMQDKAHFFFVAAGAAHGMVKTRAHAHQTAQLETPQLLHSLDPSGRKLNASQKKAIASAMSRYYEARATNGADSVKAHRQLMADVGKTVGNNAKAKQIVAEFMAPAAYGAALQTAPKIDMSGDAQAVREQVAKAETHVAKKLMDLGQAKTKGEAKQKARQLLAAQNVGAVLKQSKVDDVDLTKGDAQTQLRLQKRMADAADQLVTKGLASDATTAMSLVHQSVQGRIAAQAGAASGQAGLTKNAKAAQAAALAYTHANTAVPPGTPNGPKQRAAIRDAMIAHLNGTETLNRDDLAKKVGDETAKKIVEGIAHHEATEKHQRGTRGYRDAQARALKAMGVKSADADAIVGRDLAEDSATLLAAEHGYTPAVRHAIAGELAKVESQPGERSPEDYARLERDLAKALRGEGVAKRDAERIANDVAANRALDVAHQQAMKRSGLDPQKPQPKTVEAYLVALRTGLNQARRPFKEQKQVAADAQKHLVATSAAADLQKHQGDLSAQRRVVAEHAKKLGMSDKHVQRLADEATFEIASRKIIHEAASQTPPPSATEVRGQIRAAMIAAQPAGQKDSGRVDAIMNPHLAKLAGEVPQTTTRRAAEDARTAAEIEARTGKEVVKISHIPQGHSRFVTSDGQTHDARYGTSNVKAMVGTVEAAAKKGAHTIVDTGMMTPKQVEKLRRALDKKGLADDVTFRNGFSDDVNALATKHDIPPDEALSLARTLEQAGAGAKVVAVGEDAIKRHLGIPKNEKGVKMPEHLVRGADGKFYAAELKNMQAPGSEYAEHAAQKFQELAKRLGPDKVGGFELHIRRGADLGDYSVGPNGNLMHDGQPVLAGGKPIEVVQKDLPTTEGTVQAKHEASAVATVDDVVDIALDEFPDLAAAQRLSQGDLADRVYWEGYNPHGVAKATSMTQQEYRAKLAGKGIEHGPWHVRLGAAGTPDGSTPLQRYYFNVNADGAPGLADHLTKRLNEMNVPFQFKMQNDVANFDRRDAGVLYVDPAHAGIADGIIKGYLENNPGAMADGTPAMTEQIARGVSTAADPNIPLLPPGTNWSFGSSRAYIIAEAIKTAPPNATRDQLKQRVRERMQYYGLDPDQPWLDSTHGQQED